MLDRWLHAWRGLYQFTNSPGGGGATRLSNRCLLLFGSSGHPEASCEPASFDGLASDEAAAAAQHRGPCSPGRGLGGQQWMPGGGNPGGIRLYRTLLWRWIRRFTPALPKVQVPRLVAFPHPSCQCRLFRPRKSPSSRSCGARGTGLNRFSADGLAWQHAC